jgi:DNA polymerase-3 subunit beta
MKVSVLQENLSNALSIVSRAVATRSTLPVLSNIYIGADGDRLKLAATNLELFIVAWVGAKIEKSGATTLPARLFADLVSQSPQERIDLALGKGEELRYRCGQVDSKIKGIAADEFPIMPVASQEGAVSVPAALLKEMIGQVAFAAATDESRPILTGVLFDLQGDTLTLAATDGFRLSVRTVQLEEAAGQDLRAVVPARALNELGRILADRDEPIELSITPNRNQIIFDLGNVVMVSALIEGNFPDYNQIIPKSSTTRTTAGRDELLRSVKRAGIFARNGSNNVIFGLHSENGSPAHISVNAEATEVGGNSEEVSAQIEGESHPIAFNAKYLTEYLAAAGTREVAIETTKKESPGRFSAVGVEGWTHIIMPVHIGKKEGER